MRDRPTSHTAHRATASIPQPGSKVNGLLAVWFRSGQVHESEKARHSRDLRSRARLCHPRPTGSVKEAEHPLKSTHQSKLNTLDSAVPPAKPEHFAKCNACRYAFQRREAQIDMRDFRRHKAECPKRLSMELKPAQAQQIGTSTDVSLSK